MDIRHLINLLPSYYKEFDSYKVEGKGLLERFLEIIGNHLYKVKENINSFLNVISISKTKPENLDLLASNMGGLPFTGKNVVTSLKLTDEQRRDLIACSSYLIKNRGSREFFHILFKKLSNSDNNLYIAIKESSYLNDPGYVNTVVDYYSELDNSNLDVTDQFSMIPTVRYLVRGNFPNSVNKAITDVLYNFSPFNVKPLVYINGEFQSQLDTPLQLSIEYFNRVTNGWEKVPDTFNLGSETNYFRVVAYNTNTHKLVKGISITSKYESNSTKLFGTNSKDKLVTPYYYELKSLPDGITSFSRTFYPVPTVPGSGEDIGTGVKVKYLYDRSIKEDVYNVEVIPLFDTADTQSDGVISIHTYKYSPSVVAVRATRTMGGSRRVLSVIQHNDKHIVVPTTIWYNSNTRDYTTKKPKDLNGCRVLEGVAIFVLDKFTDYTFSPVNNRSSRKVVRLVESKINIVGKIMVRQIYPVTTKWVRSLRAIIQEDVMGNRVMPKINILVLNPHIPTVWLGDGTLLTANRLFDDMLSGTNTDWKLDTKRNTQLAIEVWKRELYQYSNWFNNFTHEKGSSWSNGSLVPITLNMVESCQIVSVEYPDDILPATITTEVVKAPIVRFLEHSGTPQYIKFQDTGASIHVRIGEINEAFAGKERTFFVGKGGNYLYGLGSIDMSKVVVLVQSPDGKSNKLDLNAEGSSVDSDGKKVVRITTEDQKYIITYKNIGTNNTIDVLSNIPGRFTFKVISHEGTTPLDIDVLDAYTSPEVVHNEPAYITLASSNGRLQGGKVQSTLYVADKDFKDLYLSWQPIDSKGAAVIPYNKNVSYDEPDTKYHRSFDIRTGIPVTRYGDIVLTLPEYPAVKHTVHVLEKPVPTANLSISPTSIKESVGKTTTVHIVVEDPREAKNFSASYIDGITGGVITLNDGDKFTAPKYGKYSIRLMYMGKPVNSSSPVIFEVIPKEGTQVEPETNNIHVSPESITFDNSFGGMDYELYDSRQQEAATAAMYGSDEIVINEITRVIDIQTTEKWTLTLEDQ